MVHLVTLIVIVPLAMWKAFVATKLWAWFVVPIGAPAIPLLSMMGIVLLIDMLFRRISEDDNPLTWERFGTGLSHSVLVPALCLGFGWLYITIGAK